MIEVGRLATGTSFRLRLPLGRLPAGTLCTVEQPAEDRGHGLKAFVRVGDTDSRFALPADVLVDIVPAGGNVGGD